MLGDDVEVGEAALGGGEPVDGVFSAAAAVKDGEILERDELLELRLRNVEIVLLGCDRESGDLKLLNLRLQNLNGTLRFCFRGIGNGRIYAALVSGNGPRLLSSAHILGIKVMEPMGLW